MPSHRSLFVLVLALLALPVSVARADRHVATTGVDTGNDCTNPAQPCRTIQRALDLVGNGEEIRVQRGTYLEFLTVTRSTFGVEILGGWFPGGTGRTIDPSATVIDNQGAGSVITINTGFNDLDLGIDNLTVTGGDAQRGGGLYFEASAANAGGRVDVSNVDFVGNRARFAGGAIHVESPLVLGLQRLTVTSSTFRNNQVTEGDGGAVSILNFTDQATVTISDSLFESNSASGDGGAIRAQGADDSTPLANTLTLLMSRNRISENSAGGQGAGVFLGSDDKALVAGIFTSNLIVENAGRGILAQADRGDIQLSLAGDTIADNSGGGVLTDEANLGGVVDVTVQNAVLWSNGNVDLRIDFRCSGEAAYSDIGSITVETDPSIGGTYTDGGGNISQDPLFIDPVSLNYRVRWDSPVVDAGSCALTPGVDFDDEARPDPVTGLCDMGFDELYNARLNDGTAGNVVDDDRFLSNSGLDVLNDGCVPDSACPVGRDPTQVDIVAGAQLGRFVRTFNDSVATLRGGATSGGTLYAADASRIEVIGSDFEVDGAPAPMGDLTVTTGMLTGELESGEPFDLLFYQGEVGGDWEGSVRLLGPDAAQRFDNGATNTILDFSFANDFVAVRNAGCDGWLDCGAPGAPTQLNLVDGQTQELQVFDTSSLDMTGGFIAGSVLANDSADLRLRGGAASGDLAAFGDSSVDLGFEGGGTFFSGGLFVRDNAAVDITWGDVFGDVDVSDSASALVKRGGARKTLRSSDSATIGVFGYDFEVNGVDVPYGPLAALSGRLDGEMLVDGLSTFDFERAGGDIVLVEGVTIYWNAGGEELLGSTGFGLARSYVRNQGCTGDPAIRCTSSSVPTTLRLVGSALVGSRLYVSDDSRVVMEDGLVGGRLRAFHDAQVDMSGGVVQRGVTIGGAARFGMTGGDITGLGLTEQASALLEGGIVRFGASAGTVSSLVLDGASVQGDVSIDGGASFEMRSGSITGDLDFASTTTLRLEGGSIGGQLQMTRGALELVGGSVAGGAQLGAFGPPVTVSITGGQIDGDVLVNGGAQVTMSGGVLLDVLRPGDQSVVAVETGSLRALAAAGQANVDVTGGEIGDFSFNENLTAAGASRIRVFGTGFQVDGAPVPLGDLVATSGQLTGTLSEGDALDTRFRQGEPFGLFTGTIELVPEPAVAWLHAAAVACVVALRRRRSGRAA